jgi:glycosyltransferase involved in cell wall biosynthesis
MSKMAIRAVLLIVENCSVPFDQRVWQEARSLRRAGYHVHVIAPKEPGQASRETLEEVEIHRHPVLPEGSGLFGYTVEYGAALFWETLLAWRVFLRHGFEVVHVSNPPDTLFLVGVIFKLVFGTRLIFDHHDICPELYEAKFGRHGPAYRVMTWLEKASIRVADLVISTNESYRQIAIERAGKPRSRVVVVRNGPNLDRVRRMPPMPSLKQGRATLVGYVGLIGEKEGLQYLVRAAAHIVHRRRRVDIHFVVIGDGPALSDIRALTKQLGVEEFFSFTGRLSDQFLMRHLSTADICVAPDEVNAMNDKSTMIKIMEYMALAKPIVQFDMAEGRYSAGEASLYATPNDAVDFATRIVELADDPAKRVIMGEMGRRRVEAELAWSHQVPKLLAAYESLWSAPGLTKTKAAARGTP